MFYIYLTVLFFFDNILFLTNTVHILHIFTLNLYLMSAFKNVNCACTILVAKSSKYTFRPQVLPFNHDCFVIRSNKIMIFW